MTTIIAVWCGVAMTIAIIVGAIVVRDLVQEIQRAKYGSIDKRQVAIEAFALLMLTTYAILSAERFLTLFR